MQTLASHLYRRSMATMLAAPLLAVSLLPIAASAQAGTGQLVADKTVTEKTPAAGEISVIADAVIFLPPDAVELRIAVDASGPTAHSAQALATQKMGLAIENIGKISPSGIVVAEDGLKFQVGAAAGGSVTVSKMSSISVTSLEPNQEKIGQLIDGLTKDTGAKLIGVRYLVNDRTAEKAAAHKQAVERARKKAEAAAHAAGLSLGPITAINLVEEAANKLVRLREAQGDGEQFTGGEDYQVVAAVTFGVTK